MALADRLPQGAEIICADSMQLYRGMDIGTAKPTAADRAHIPHHCLDLADPHREGFTVQSWRALAELAIAQVQQRGGWPIIVGGTNLYVKALGEGLFVGPPADIELRASLAAVAANELHRRLAAVDPQAAERIHPNDRRRLTRALEVNHATGEPISRLQAQWGESGLRLPEGWRLIGVEPTPTETNRRVRERTDQMMAEGFLREVERLHAVGPLHPQPAAALGYRELLAHIAGQCTLPAAVESIRIHTRQLAKQQRTWLRRFRTAPGSIWLEGAAEPSAAATNLCTEICGSI